MQVTVRGGAAWIEGRSYVQGRIRGGRIDPIDVTLDIEENTSGVMRRDMIVVEHSLLRQRRDIQVLYIPGSTTLIRNDDVYQLKLAEITVNPGTTGIAQSNITDTRLNSEECGIMYSMVDNVDTTTIFKQYMDYLERKQTEWNALQASEQLIWQEQTARQESDWQAQTQAQKADYESWKASMEAWRSEVIAEFQQKIGFNFDNQINMPGTTKTFDDSVSNQIREQIRFSYEDLLVADMLTTFNGDGSIDQVLTIFNADGSTFSASRQTTTFPGGKPRTEVVNYVG